MIRIERTDVHENDQAVPPVLSTLSHRYAQPLKAPAAALSSSDPINQTEVGADATGTSWFEAAKRWVSEQAKRVTTPVVKAIAKIVDVLTPIVAAILRVIWIVIKPVLIVVGYVLWGILALAGFIVAGAIYLALLAGWIWLWCALIWWVVSSLAGLIFGWLS